MSSRLAASIGLRRLALAAAAVAVLVLLVGAAEAALRCLLCCWQRRTFPSITASGRVESLAFPEAIRLLSFPGLSSLAAAEALVGLLEESVGLGLAATSILAAVSEVQEMDWQPVVVEELPVLVEVVGRVALVAVVLGCLDTIQRAVAAAADIPLLGNTERVQVEDQVRQEEMGRLHSVQLKHLSVSLQ